MARRKIEKTLDRLEELAYRIQMLAGTAQCIVDQRGASRDSTEKAIDHFAFELIKHGHKMAELVEIAQRCTMKSPNAA